MENDQWVQLVVVGLVL